MKITLELRGLSGFIQGLEEAPAQLDAGMMAAIREVTTSIVNVVRGRSPEGPGHFGIHLRDSWTDEIFRHPKSIVGLIRTDAIQGRWLEDGTQSHEIAPRAGLAMAFEANSGQVFSRRAIRHPGQIGRKILDSTVRAGAGVFNSAVNSELRALFAGIAGRSSTGG